MKAGIVTVPEYNPRESASLVRLLPLSLHTPTAIHGVLPSISQTLSYLLILLLHLLVLLLL